MSIRRVLAVVCLIQWGVVAGQPAGANVGDRCDVSGWNYFCETPSALVRTYGYMVALHDLRSGGASAERLGVIYGSGCAFVPQGVRLIVQEQRAFRTMDGEVPLARVTFDGMQLTHQEDRYTPEGEYIGKKSISHTEGWMARQDLKCAAK